MDEEPETKSEPNADVLNSNNNAGEKIVNINFNSYYCDTKQCRHSKLSNQEKNLYREAQLFGTILQWFIVIFLSTLILFNVYLLFRLCNSNKIISKLAASSYCISCIKGFIILSIIFVNILTAVLFAYDMHQAKVGGYRLLEWFLIFLMWSGGWICAWIILLLFNYKRNKKRSLFKGVALAFTLNSITTPIFYFLYVIR